MANETLPATAFKSPAIALSGVVNYEMYTKFRTQFDNASDLHRVVIRCCKHGTRFIRFKADVFLHSNLVFHATGHLVSLANLEWRPHCEPSLVPWRPVLERAKGQSVIGVVGGEGISWSIGIKRGLGR